MAFQTLHPAPDHDRALTLHLTLTFPPVPPPSRPFLLPPLAEKKRRQKHTTEDKRRQKLTAKQAQKEKSYPN
jgi:hypothetical protein